MAAMISEVYGALLEAGAGDKARRAAEVLAKYDNRFNHVKAELVALKGDIQGQQHLQTGTAARALGRKDVGPSSEVFLRHEQDQVFASAHGRSDL